MIKKITIIITLMIMIISFFLAIKFIKYKQSIILNDEYSNDDETEDGTLTTMPIDRSVSTAAVGILNGDLITRLTKKNGDWNGIPLSDSFKKKFNEKDGVLGKLKYDKFEYCPFLNIDGHPLDEREHFVITNGKAKTAYLYTYEDISIDYKEKIDDFIILETIPLTDENGNEIEFRINLREDNFNRSMYDICYSYEREKGIGTTENFRKKFPHFINLFIHFSPAYFNVLRFVEEKSSWKKKEAYFVVNSSLECKNRHYLVELKLDDNGYLDDAVVHMVNEEEYESRDRNYRLPKLIYKNSNWQNLELTKNYRQKFNNQSCQLDIDDIDIDYFFESIRLNDNQEYIYKCKMKNGKYSFYFYKFIYSEDAPKYLDDIICERLDYGDMSLEDAKERFLSERSLK